VFGLFLAKKTGFAQSIAVKIPHPQQRSSTYLLVFHISSLWAIDDDVIFFLYLFTAMGL
jgi:energy-converting hydrogenase Eha subunit H